MDNDTQQTDNEYSRYCAEIDLYEKDFRPWRDRSRKIVRLYKDADNEGNKKKRFNVLWSNVQTLQPALYARDPQPVAERRFKDADPVGRTASEVLERCISYTIDEYGFGQCMRQAVSDRLLPGRGILWNRYKPTIETAVQETENAEPEDELTFEQAVTDYVYWEDFGHAIARTWDEVPMVWRKVYLDRSELVKRFGDTGKTIKLDHSPRTIKDEKQGEHLKKARIYEIWDRVKGQVVFLSKSHPEIIETDADPLTLTGMFPCARPLYATVTTDELIPVPDYALYQTQATEIENLTRRINALQKALKVVGVYDASAPELGRLLNEGYENKLVPVDTYAAFAEKGGIAGAIDFVPLKDIASTLIALYEARDKAKEDLYEITGIADIIRGNSDPRETAKAQQIKGRFAVLRISDSQEDVQRFARDNIRIIAEIIAEHFSLETIKQISGVRLLTAEEKKAYQAIEQQSQMVARMSGQPPQSQLPEEIRDLMNEPTWDEVHALLQDQVLRNFRIDIETDSTIRTDEDADRAERTEFLTAAGTYIEKAVQASAAVPELLPLLGEMLMFGIRGHRAARQLETVFDDAMREMKKPKQPKPDPEVTKIEAEAKLEQQRITAETEAEKRKQQFQHDQEMAAQAMADERANREHHRTMELEREKAQLEVDTRIRIAQIDADAKIAAARESTLRPN